MASTKPYIGCNIGLISKAQNRYEGILYTIDKVNSTLVLAKVRCFGTEGRPTDRPTPPKNQVYEYITFRGSDIKDIALCDPSHPGLPPDPAIIHSSSAISSNIYPTYGPISPLKGPTYNSLAATSLLTQQHAGGAIGPLLQDVHVRRGPMVEKAVQTSRMERSGVRRDLTPPRGQQRNGRRLQRPRNEGFQNRRDGTAKGLPGRRLTSLEPEKLQQDMENRPPTSARQGTRRRRSHGRGRLLMANVLSPTLKFETDFDFVSSNAQFMKEELEREKTNTKETDFEIDEKINEDDTDAKVFRPKCYYDKSKSFFDNIPSDSGFRLTWAEERKRNLETFGVPGHFFRGRSFRGGFGGQRRQGFSQSRPLNNIQRGRL